MRIPMQSDHELQNQTNSNNPAVDLSLGLSKQQSQSGQNSHSSLQVLHSLQQLQQVHALTSLAPNDSPNPIIPATTTTTTNQSNNGNTTTVSALDSIATAAVSQLDERQERLRKRRSQIAAASRKSRAKRKREVAILKTENERLSTEIMELKKRLKELGEEVSLDVDLDATVSGDDIDARREKMNSNLNLNPKTSYFELEEKLGSGFSSNGEQNVQVQNQNASAKLIHAKEDTKPTPIKSEHGMNANDPVPLKELDLTATEEFFKKRLAIYFSQLKSDTINHLAPEAADALKQRISNLEVKLVLNTEEALSKYKNSL